MTTKKKYIATPIIFGLAALILVLGVIWPLLAEIKNSSSRLADAKNTIASLQAENTNIENFKKNTVDVAKNLDTANQLFIDPQNPVNVITFLETIARDAGLSAKISLLPNAGQKNNTITFQIAATDDFLKLMRFSEKLENSPYLMEIEKISMASAGNANTSKNSNLGNVDAVFTVNTFAQQ